MGRLSRSTMPASGYEPPISDTLVFMVLIQKDMYRLEKTITFDIFTFSLFCACQEPRVEDSRPYRITRNPEKDYL